MDRPLGQNWPNAYYEMKAKYERLREALKAIADDPDTNVEAAVYARNVLADEQSAKVTGETKW